MDFADQPIDPTSAERLAAQQLRLGLVDTSDREAFAAWYHADVRGFHGGRLTDDELGQRLSRAAYRRTTGVWDAAASDPATPVATVSSWPTPLTVPTSTAGRENGARSESTVPAWAISSVTVAPTHRRRGVARGLLEAELRTANRLGVPIAMLTVSEATIYGRYGFAPAVFAADLAIESRRVRWDGPVPSGRVHLITLEELHEQAAAVYDRARLLTPGEIQLDDLLWRILTGVIADADDAKHLRAVRYDDVAGQPQGFALYRVSGGDDDFTKHTVDVRYLLAATDEAYAALWRYVLEIDLVSTVKAPLRSVDEPVRWQLGDRRAARVTTYDHLWLRILDVKASLEARGYAAAEASGTRITLEVDDPLGFAAGRWLLEIDASGRGTVSQLRTEASADAAVVALSVNSLSALYLGGVCAATLVRAGAITEVRPGSADVLDAAFRSAVTPWLSTWF